jgi:hypothetical protein
MSRAFTRRDEGKPVVTPRGETLGSVARTEAGEAHVCPRSELVAGWGSWLTGSLCRRETFKLDRTAVERITDEAVVVDPMAATRGRAETAVKK